MSSTTRANICILIKSKFFLYWYYHEITFTRGTLHSSMQQHIRSFILRKHFYRVMTQTRDFTVAWPHRQWNPRYANNSHKCLYKTLRSVSCCQKCCFTFPLTAPHEHSHTPGTNNRNRLRDLQLVLTQSDVCYCSEWMNQSWWIRIIWKRSWGRLNHKPLSTLQLSFKRLDPHHHSIHPPFPHRSHILKEWSNYCC